MSQYFDREPEVQSARRQISYQVEAKHLSFTSDQGVFSKNHVDMGSDLLIRTAARDLRDRGIKRGRLLDLGCGIGVIGIALKRLITPFELTLVDVNQRALELSEENLVANQIRYARVLESDGFLGLVGETFDVIVTNPPIRAGKAVVYRFFEGAREQLNPGGTLYVVIGKKQGAESAKRKLSDLFDTVDLLAREKGFHIYACRVAGGEAITEGVEENGTAEFDE